MGNVLAIALLRDEFWSLSQFLVSFYSMRVRSHGSISEETRAQIESEILVAENLKDVMRWALRQPKGTFLPQIVADVIVQDEFTHDCVIPRSDGLVLVFDTT